VRASGAFRKHRQTDEVEHSPTGRSRVVRALSRDTTENAQVARARKIGETMSFLYSKEP